MNIEEQRTAQTHPILESVGAHIAALRLKKNWSQAELAKAAHIDRSFISQLENGHRNVSVLTLFVLAEALGVRVSQFFK